MLIFGDPTPPRQHGMPFPAIRFALAVPAETATKPVLHSFGCPLIPAHAHLAAAGLRELVYSTTYDEISDHAIDNFGEDGWRPCDRCGG